MFEYTWLVAFMLKLQISGKKVNMLMIFQNLHKGPFFHLNKTKWFNLHIEPYTLYITSI